MTGKTGRTTWKQEERKVARALGGERNPLSGSNSRHTGGDVIQTPYYVDCKLSGQENSTGQKHYTLHKSSIRKVREDTEEEEKDLGLLTVRFKNTSDRYALLPAEYFCELQGSPVTATSAVTHQSGGQHTSRIYRKLLQEMCHTFLPKKDEPTQVHLKWVGEDIPDAVFITWESLLWQLGRLRVCPECQAHTILDEEKPEIECQDCGILMERWE